MRLSAFSYQCEKSVVRLTRFGRVSKAEVYSTKSGKVYCYFLSIPNLLLSHC
jgi:hypothetical protein